MIDKDKWEASSDDMKMKAIKVIRELMTENSVTKADNRLITDYLLKRCERED